MAVSEQETCSKQVPAFYWTDVVFVCSAQISTTSVMRLSALAPGVPSPTVAVDLELSWVQTDKRVWVREGRGGETVQEIKEHKILRNAFIFIKISVFSCVWRIFGRSISLDILLIKDR